MLYIPRHNLLRQQQFSVHTRAPTQTAPATCTTSCPFHLIATASVPIQTAKLVLLILRAADSCLDGQIWLSNGEEPVLQVV